jgi:hypothetical protein
MITFSDIFGTTGTVTLIGAYIMTTYDQFGVKNLLIIDLLNIYGSFALSYDCLVKKTYPPLLLESVWFIISTTSLIRRVYHRPVKDVEKSVIQTIKDTGYQSI